MKIGYLKVQAVCHGARARNEYSVVDGSGNEILPSCIRISTARDRAHQNGIVLLENGMTEAQLQALLRWRAHYGMQWKKHLRYLWMDESHIPMDLKADSGYLRQLRNQQGPSWLITFKLPETE